MTDLSAIGVTLFLIAVCALAIWALNRFIVNKAFKFSNRILEEQKRISDEVSNTAMEQHLQREGVATTAQVLDAADTGGRVDAVFVLTRLQLRVAATERPEGYMAEIVVPLSRCG